MLFDGSVAPGGSGYFELYVTTCRQSGYMLAFWYKLSQGCDLEISLYGNLVVLPGPQGPGQWQYVEEGYGFSPERRGPLKIGAVKKETAACGLSIDDVQFYRFTDIGAAATRRDTGAAGAQLETIGYIIVVLILVLTNCNVPQPKHPVAIQTRLVKLAVATMKHRFRIRYSW
jgi:hypothetical protein